MYITEIFVSKVKMRISLHHTQTYMCNIGRGLLTFYNIIHAHSKKNSLFEISELGNGDFVYSLLGVIQFISL